MSLAIIAVDNVGTLISRRIHTRRSERGRQLERAAMSLAILVARSWADVRFEHLGVSVFVETRWSKIRRLSGSEVRLRRVSRFRPAEFPQQSGISWSGEKGAVGECWRTKKHSYVNWQAVAKKWGDLDLTEEDFEKIAIKTRAGFSRTDFSAIAGKYSEVHAEPIWHGKKERELLGVLSIDRVFSAEDDPFISRLDSQGTREAAAGAASAAAAILRPINES
ncbi:hypothetical protein [Salinibacterium sp.]|uniref:hypothetical protein n=1 Tax=Salinibacterium sp. TaxID=1915057 RepID=UPI00286AC1FA|nr:hypothetical protein [Salinibacterium sp.]